MTTTSISQFKITSLQLAADIMRRIIVVLVNVGNILTLIAIAKYWYLRTKSNAFIASLSAADLFLSINILFTDYFGGALKISYRLYYCYFVHFSYVYSMTNSCIHVAAIAVERYLAVLYPLHYNTMVTKRTITISLVAMWIISLALATVGFFWKNQHPTETQVQLCNTRAGGHVWLDVTFILITITVAIVLYSKIFVEAWKQAQKVHNIQVQPDSAKLSIKDIKAAKVLSLIVGLYIACWMPRCVYLILVLTGHILFRAGAHNFILNFAILNSGLNVFIYAGMNTMFRKAFKDMFTCKRCKAHK